MPGHRLSSLAKGTPLESRLSIGTIALGVNLFPRLCAGQSKGILKREKNVVLDLAPVLHPRYKISEFTIAAPVLTSTLTVCRRNRGDPSYLGCVTSITGKTCVPVWPGTAHAPIAI